MFLAFTTPFGIAAHLVSELAGLGWRDDADVLISARHGYLAALAAASLAVLGAALLAVPCGQRRARVASLIEGLPYRGRGVSFVATAFVVQFVFFAVTQLGEGCPLCGGDVLIGVAAAGLAAILGAIAVAFGQRRFLDLALTLVLLFAPEGGTRPLASGSALDRAPVARGTRRSPFAFRYRPPPHVAA